MSGISDLTAAELSAAAYTPFERFSDAVYVNSLDNTQVHVNGWSIDYGNSYSTGNNISSYFTGNTAERTNQFYTYVNSTIKQVVVAFKGSDNAINLYSDLENDGFSQWESLKHEAKQHWRESE